MRSIFQPVVSNLVETSRCTTQLDDVNVILPNKRVDNSINKLLPKTIFFFENLLLNCCHSVCLRLPQGFVDEAETPPTIEVSVRIKQI